MSIYTIRVGAFVQVVCVSLVGSNHFSSLFSATYKIPIERIEKVTRSRNEQMLFLLLLEEAKGMDNLGEKRTE